MIFLAPWHTLEQSGVRRISMRSNHHLLFASVTVPQLSLSYTHKKGFSGHHHSFVLKLCLAFPLLWCNCQWILKRGPQQSQSLCQTLPKAQCQTFTPESCTTDLTAIKPHVWDLSCSVCQFYSLKFGVTILHFNT